MEWVSFKPTSKGEGAMDDENGEDEDDELMCTTYKTSETSFDEADVVDPEV